MHMSDMLTVTQSILQELSEPSSGWIHLQMLDIDWSLHFISFYNSHTLPVKDQIIFVTRLNFLKVLDAPLESALSYNSRKGLTQWSDIYMFIQTHMCLYKHKLKKLLLKQNAQI